MDLRKAIEKLNSIDANDLKKIDFSKLKEFNLERIKEDLMTKPKVLINTIFVSIAFFSVIYSISIYKMEVSVFNKHNAEMKQRVDVLEKKKTAESNYNQFIEQFPKSIPNEQLIGRISEFAEKAHINIVSFSPVQTSDSEFTTQYIVNLIVEAKTYQDLVDFMSIIENSAHTLRINRWNIRSMGQSLNRLKEQSDIPLSATMEIGSIRLKDV